MVYSSAQQTTSVLINFELDLAQLFPAVWFMQRLRTNTANYIQGLGSCCAASCRMENSTTFEAPVLLQAADHQISPATKVYSMILDDATI